MYGRYQITRNQIMRMWLRTKKGIKKGQPLRFVCGHHRRNVPQSKEEKLKRVSKWGVTDISISPYLPGNKIVRYYPFQKRWYCSIVNSKKTHAKLVYEYYFGKVPDGYAIHHKSGSAEKIEDDRPDNLIAIPKIWNLHYMPYLAFGFNIPESEVTKYYIVAVDKFPEKQIFKEVCRMLLKDNK